ncbi:hypothetical protein PQX77_016182 [Marasmius sp. AFHP31]|nr:hypothetical protein PQX77_016182 [Marasmius sp. AFHP31]
MASQDELEEFVAPYLTVRQVIVDPIATLSSMFLVYGMYMIIFGLCISFATAFMTSIRLANYDKFRKMYLVEVKIDQANNIALAVFNGLLSLLAAGRIWWISRDARHHMGVPVQARYQTVSTVILESGILYPTTLIASIVVPIIYDKHSHGTLPVDLTAVAYLIAGLAPTLIIVRVAYGTSVDSVQQMVSNSIHFAERESQQGVGISALQANVNIHSQTQSNDTSSGSQMEETPSEKHEEGRMV